MTLRQERDAEPETVTPEWQSPLCQEPRQLLLEGTVEAVGISADRFDPDQEPSQEESREPRREQGRNEQPAEDGLDHTMFQSI
jgi:hypothetical protein